MCNTYVEEVASQRQPRSTQNRRERSYSEPYLPQMVDFGRKYLRLHGIFTKQKILPDPKFTVSIDESYKATLGQMHDFVGANPNPVETELSMDAAYNIRWRGVMLIDYLVDLSRRPYRFLSISIVRLSIYLLIPLTLISAAVALIKTIF